MNKFFEKTGPMAIATRMRLLSERMAKDAQKIYDLYNKDLKAKWYPVIFCLMNDESINTVTSIANEIGQTHVSVVKIVKELICEEIVYEEKDIEDGRKTNLYLTNKGKDIASNLKYQHLDVTNVIDKMLENTQNNLWKSLSEFEDILDEKSTYKRVIEEYRNREISNIKVVNFTSEYKEVFYSLNKDWIDEFFTYEDIDKKVLENPKEEILDKGGVILLALYKNKPVGTCSLIKLENSICDYELSKMAVDKEYQKKGIGIALGNEIINKAKELKINSILIETNSILQSAISLYKKLGFKRIEVEKKSYFRTNYYMQLNLKDK